MKENGSPQPEFEFDEDHSYFLVRLPVHPESQHVVERKKGGATPPVTPPVERLLELLAGKGDMGNAEIRQQLGLKDRTHVRLSTLIRDLTKG